MNTINIKSKKLFNYLFLAIAIVALAFVSACTDDDPPLPDNFAQFESDALGITDTESELEINIQLSRAVDQDAMVTIQFTTNGLEYGEDFTTIPAATGSSVTLTIPSGSETVALTIVKAEDILLDGDESITLTITSASELLRIGSRSSLELSFAEIIATQGALDINGGGPAFSNKVFIDLSANRQTAVERTAWDLGFYSGEDFRVILNSSTTMMARALEKNDLNAVTEDDTLGFDSEVTVSAFNPEAVAWIDDPSGDLMKTAIAEVSANDEENKVYIINRGDGIGTPAPHRGWKKIRVLRNGDGYTLQHADINATTFEEIAIAKDDLHRFTYVHFENGEVEIEPVKDRWDIAWTYFMNTTYFGPEPIPYTFQDMVIQNHGVEVAKVLTADVAFDLFDADDIEGLTFTASQTGIGADWRKTTPAPAEVYADRYYIIRDAGGNYYKLKFTALTTDGERGRPKIEFVLID